MSAQLRHGELDLTACSLGMKVTIEHERIAEEAMFLAQGLKEGFPFRQDHARSTDRTNAHTLN